MAQVVKRKVIKVGNSLMVSLPPGWLRFNKVKAGDTVDVLSNGKVTVKTPGNCQQP